MCMHLVARHHASSFTGDASDECLAPGTETVPDHRPREPFLGRIEADFSQVCYVVCTNVAAVLNLYTICEVLHRYK